MVLYQKTLYALVDQLGITDESLKNETYYDIEQSFLDQRLERLFSELSSDDQKLVNQKIEQWATPEQVYAFLDATIDDMDALNEKILSDFVQEYKKLMWL